MYSCTLMNVTGDITISWDESTSEDVKNWIESKIKEGYTFFVSEKRCMGLWTSQKEVKDIESLSKTKGKITLDTEQEKEFLSGNVKFFSGDKGVEKLIVNKKVQAKRVKKKHLSTNKVSTCATEIVQSHSVCMKPMMGG